MKILFIFILSFITTFYSFGSHLAGAYIELEHLENDNYNLILHIFFDEINGNPGSLDPSVRIDFYENVSNNYITSYNLPLVEQLNVTAPEDMGEFVNYSEIIYSRTIVLSLKDLLKEDGYYFTYARCCRSNTLTNIYSGNDPSEAAGMTVYYQFKPYNKEKSTFSYNSSPVYQNPQVLIAQVGSSMAYHPGITDPNGDSLVYKLIIPKQTLTSEAISNPAPMPYPDATLKDGFTKENLIPGTPPLSVDPVSGLISVNPMYSGTYAYAIMVYEYKHGSKIAESIIELPPILVISPFQETNDFAASVQIFDAENIELKPEDILHFDEPNTCYTVKIASTDSLEISGNFYPVNFPYTYLNFTLIENDIEENIKHYSLCSTSKAINKNNMSFFISLKDSSVIPNDDNYFFQASLNYNSEDPFKIWINNRPLNSQLRLDTTIHVDSLLSITTKIENTNPEYSYTISTYPGFDTTEILWESFSHVTDQKHMHNINVSFPAEYFEDGSKNIYELLLTITEIKPEPSQAVLIPVSMELTKEKAEQIVSIYSEHNEIIYSPNPFSETIEITLKSGNSLIRVYNLDGKILLSDSVEAIHYTINGSSWKTGIYLLIIESQGGVTVAKIIKD